MIKDAAITLVWFIVLIVVAIFSITTLRSVDGGPRSIFTDVGFER